MEDGRLGHARWSPARAMPATDHLGDRVLAPHQVAALRSALIVMVVFDSVATWVWVRYGVAVEGNPVVAAVMATVGDGTGLLVRALWSIVLVLVLCRIAERRVSVRPALVVVLVVLGGVTVLHVSELAFAWAILLA